MTRLCALFEPGSDCPAFEIDDDMIEVGVALLADFEPNDGSCLRERVVEVFLAMYTSAHGQVVAHQRAADD